jgi:hypothetical protein
MKPVTDPALLAQLNAAQPVTDPALLAQLNSPLHEGDANYRPTVSALQDQFWQATRAGDHDAAIQALKGLKAEGVNVGPAPDMAGDAARKTADSDSVGQNSVSGLGEGMRKAGRGIIQAAAMVSPVSAPAYWTSPNVRSAVDNMLPDNPNADAALNKTAGGMSSNVVGQAVPFAIAPEVSTPREAAMLATAQGFAVPLPTGQNTLKNRVFSAAAAGPLGRVSYGLTRSLANKTASVAAGALPVETQANMDAAKSVSQMTGLPAPMTLGDLGSVHARQVQDNVLENIPGSGRITEMTRQREAVAAGIKKLRDSFPVLPEPPQNIMQRSALTAQQSAKGAARLAYDAVEKASQGAPPIATRAATTVLRDAIVKYPELLNRIGNSATRAKIEGLLSGKPISFADSREIISAVNGESAAAQAQLRNGVSGAKDAALHYGRLSAALEADQNAWGQQTGGKVLQSLRDANKLYRETVIPYRAQNELKGLVKPNANPQTVLNHSPDSYETARRLMQGMTPEGRQAYATGLIDKALAKGQRPDGEVNLKTVLNALPHGRAAEVIFTLPQLKTIADLRRYAAAVDRSLNVNNTPQTGVRLAKLSGVMGASGGATALAGATLPAAALSGLGTIGLANLGRRALSGQGLTGNALRRLALSAPVESRVGQIAAQRVVLPGTNALAASYGIPLLLPPRVQQKKTP